MTSCEKLLCYQSWRVFCSLNKTNTSLLQRFMLGFQPWHRDDLQREHQSRETQTSQGKEQRESWKGFLFSQSTDSSLIKSLGSSCNMTTLFCLFFVWQTSNKISPPYSFLCSIGHRLEMHVISLLHFLLSRQISLLPAWSFRFQEDYTYRKIEEIATPQEKNFSNKYMWYRHFLSIESNCQVIVQNFSTKHMYRGKQLIRWDIEIVFTPSLI